MRLKIAAKTVFFLQRLQTRHKIAKHKGLAKVGALVRGAVKRTLRVASGSSLPGRPPHCHTRGGLRVVEFATGSHDVVIGPVKFAGSDFFNKPVPHVHEFGGTFYSRLGFYLYPQRSYMYYTLKQLHAKRMIPKEYSTEVRKVF
jgi:hypothetical protein